MITPSVPTSAVRRFFAYPIVWMLVGGVLIMGANAVCVGVGGENGPSFLAAGSVVAAVLALVLYRVVMRFLARRETVELRFDARELARGMAIGAGFIGASATAVVIAGGYELAWNPEADPSVVAFAIAVNLGAAVCEELAFRGMLLEGIERISNRAVAVGATALLFGGVHALNPAASVWSSVAIAIEAGVLLGTAYVWRRNLWFVIGLHFAWNTIEMLLGIPVSGHREPSLFLTSVHGNPWLSGGEFGIEASVVPVALSVILSVWMVRRAQVRP